MILRSKALVLLVSVVAAAVLCGGCQKQRLGAAASVAGDAPVASHEEDPEDLDELVVAIARGDQYLLREDFDRAIAQYDMALSRSDLPASVAAAAHITRGVAYSYKNEPAKALEDFNRSISLNPETAMVYLLRGLLYHDAEDYAKAIEDFDRAIALDPTDSDAYALRGDAHNITGAIEKALEDYNNAIGLNPMNHEPYNERALLVAYYKGDLESALNDVNKAIQLGPDEGYYYDTRAQILLFMGDHDAALRDFYMAVRVGDEDIDFYLREGVEFFGKLIVHDSTNSNAYAWRGVIYILTEDFDKAALDFETALSLNADNAFVKRYSENVAEKRNIFDLGGSGDVDDKADGEANGEEGGGEEAEE